ncbi:hypothetical protein GDO81_027278 [Engystomops pustulosus]|uniref:SRCR domain-containing protein n=1 Tax=Engystomops pustulosus TaxID=76066 RepID=A0AAV6YIR2_ENGPU|nr:hypothetical protein GDO81_027278 [Engystomops pustulosus]
MIKDGNNLHVGCPSGLLRNGWAPAPWGPGSCSVNAALLCRSVWNDSFRGDTGLQIYHHCPGLSLVLLGQSCNTRHRIWVRGALYSYRGADT